jgi:hypothetical protein
MLLSTRGFQQNFELLGETETEDRKTNTHMTKNILNVSMALTLLAIVTQTASALPGGNVPDATSSSLLLTIAFGGMMVVRRFIRR